MPLPTLAHDASIVLVGHFNPTIFNPAWLALNGLISKEQVAASTITVIHPQITEFTADRFQFSVQPDRFSIRTAEEPFIAISDWVRVLFSETLGHTPINQAGINYTCHFAAPSERARFRLGRALAPIEPWGEWGEALGTEADIGKGGQAPGGLLTLAMHQPTVPGRAKGYRQVQLEPSVREDIVNRSVGIFMAVNDHYEASENSQHDRTLSCVNWTTDEFEQSINRSKSIIEDMKAMVEGL